MYGKLFEQTFTGSMMGAGADIFAVWSFAIANLKPTNDVAHVELNPKHVSALIGMTTEKVEAALKFLCDPDPYSRSQADDGRRLVQEGQFIYRVVNYKKYKEIRDHEERKAYQKEWVRDKRLSTVDTCRHLSTDVDNVDQPIPIPIPRPRKEKNCIKKESKKATSLPTNFEVTERMLEWAKQEGVMAVAAETEQFKDHHTARGSTFKDWKAAWRTWMRNSLKYSKDPKAVKIDGWTDRQPWEA